MSPFITPYNWRSYSTKSFSPVGFKGTAKPKPSFCISTRHFTMSNFSATHTKLRRLIKICPSRAIAFKRRSKNSNSSSLIDNCSASAVIFCGTPARSSSSIIHSRLGRGVVYFWYSRSKYGSFSLKFIDLIFFFFVMVDNPFIVSI